MTLSTIKVILCFVLVLVALAVAGIVGNGNHYANERSETTTTIVGNQK